MTNSIRFTSRSFCFVAAALTISLHAEPARAQTATPEPTTPQPATPVPTTPAPAQPAPAAAPANVPVVPAGYVLATTPVAGTSAVPVLYIQPGALPPVDSVRDARNAVYFEYLGNAVVYSVNYERFFTEDTSARVGIGYLSVGESVSGGGVTASLTSVPVMVNWLGIGKANHRLELGAGLVFLHLSARANSGFGNEFASGFLAAGTGTVAYRYAPLDGGFSFKAGFTPLLSTFGVYPSFGLGLGATF